MSTWMLAQLKPNAEAIAMKNLERQGFKVFRPLERRTVLRRGRFVVQTRSFFPGYLFTSYPTQSAPWSLVNSTYGVARLVKFGDRLAPVPDHVIDDLRNACDEHGYLMAHRDIAVGDHVEFKDGTFSSFVGQVERLSPNERALILIDFMGAQTRVKVPTSHLRVASDQARQSRGKA